MKKEALDSIRSFHDISKAINSSLEIEEVVDVVLEKTSELMRTEKVLLLLFDSSAGVLSVHSSRGFGEGELGTESFSNVAPFDHCIMRKGSVIVLKELLPGDYYVSVGSTVYCQSQRVEKRLAARRMSAGLVIANSSEWNAADDRFSARPKGAPQIAQCCVAAT